MIKVAMFDMDGTIIHTLHIWDQILGTFVGSGNLTYFRSLRDKEPGKGMDQTCEILRKHFNVGGTNAEITAAYKKVARDIIEREPIEFVDGFSAFHDSLADKGIITCLVTNAPRYALDPIAEKLNLKQFFGDNMFSSCDVDMTFKPDPAVLMLAMNKLNVLGSECMIFEDSIQGVTAAKRAGIKRIIVVRNEEFIRDYTGTIPL